MFLPDHQTIEVLIENNYHRNYCKRKFGIADGVIILPYILSVHWTTVQKYYRYAKTKLIVQCDDCKKLYGIELRLLNPLVNTHYCRTCSHKGARNTWNKAKRRKKKPNDPSVHTSETKE